MAQMTSQGSVFRARSSPMSHSKWLWVAELLLTLAKLSDCAPVTQEYMPPQVFRAADFRHELDLRYDKSVWASGRNDFGQLGDGSVSHRLTPVKVFINSLQASAGEWHSMFLRDDGVVYACGRNEYGQVGDGTRVTRPFPMFVERSMQAVAAGGFHSVLLQSDGVAKATGQNNYGQLGDGSYVPKKRPATVQITADVQAVAAGSDHSIFLKNDGVAWATGRNHYGQLGDRTTVGKKVPVPVMSGVASVSAKYHFSLFLLTNGSLIAAGQFDSGLPRNRTDWNPIQIFSETEVQLITMPS